VGWPWTVGLHWRRMPQQGRDDTVGIQGEWIKLATFRVTPRTPASPRTMRMIQYAMPQISCRHRVSICESAKAKLCGDGALRFTPGPW
jgi:hypothetical protein